MTVFVDNVNATSPDAEEPFCRMMADSDAELDEMAAKVGIKPVRGGHMAGHPRRFFHITNSQRAVAVAAGAEAITGLEFLKRMHLRPSRPS